MSMDTEYCGKCGTLIDYEFDDNCGTCDLIDNIKVLKAALRDAVEKIEFYDDGYDWNYCDSGCDNIQGSFAREFLDSETYKKAKKLLKEK